MGQIYSISRSNVALSTTADLLTLIANVNRSFRILEISIGGMATASAANELLVMRSSAGVTPSGAVTPVPTNANNGAAALTTATAWATQPTAGVALLRLPVNSNGGIYRWVARPGGEIDVSGSGQISLRSAVGTGTISFHIIVEEF